jgi:hypothetical protein
MDLAGFEARISHSSEQLLTSGAKAQFSFGDRSARVELVPFPIRAQKKRGKAKREKRG